MAAAKLFALIDDIAAVQGDVAVPTEAATHQTVGVDLAWSTDTLRRGPWRAE